MNDEQLKVIRERHECFNADWHALDEMTTGSQIAYETEQRLSDASEHFPADVAALLEHVAAQAERLRKLEAALRLLADEQGYVEWCHMSVETVKAVQAAIGVPEYPRYADADWAPFDDIVAGVDDSYRQETKNHGNAR